MKTVVNPLGRKNFLKGLYIGRFQPFHLGHLSAIKQALEQVEKLYIGIGSSQYHDTPENPFTSQERQEMLRIGLKESEIEDKCEILLIPDIHDEKRWVEHVKSLVPAFEIVFVGNEGVVKDLFEKAQTKIIVVNQELPISASQIRQEMIEGLNWAKKLTSRVANYIESIEGLKRLKSVQEA